MRFDCSGGRREEVGIFWLQGGQGQEDLMGDPSSSPVPGPEFQCGTDWGSTHSGIAQTSGLESSTETLHMIPTARPAKPSCFKVLFPAGQLWGAVGDLLCWLADIIP